jgi:hypothetical protein
MVAGTRPLVWPRYILRTQQKGNAVQEKRTIELQCQRQLEAANRWGHNRGDEKFVTREGDGVTPSSWHRQHKIERNQVTNKLAKSCDAPTSRDDTRCYAQMMRVDSSQLD